MSEDNNLAAQAGSPRAAATPRPLSPGVLRSMAVQGTLSPDAYEAALRFLGIRPDRRQWNWFWQTILSSWGAIFFAAGVICFFAYNWANMHYFLKFALLASLILVAGLAAVWIRLDSLPGKLALLLASLSIGPLLAVYGQVYQTGAEAWELFRVWTLVMLPLALAGRQAALWLLVWLAGSAWGGLYLDSLPIPPAWYRYGILPGIAEFLLAQILFLAGWEAASHRWKNKPGQGWLEAAWFPRIVGGATIAALTLELALEIFDHYQAGYDRYLFLPERGTCAMLYIILLLGGWLWYRKKRPDLLLISCGVFSLATLLVCTLTRAMDFKGNTGELLFWGLVLAGITAGCGLFLHHLRRVMDAEQAANHEPQADSPGFWARLRPRFSWDALWNHLRQANVLTGDPPAIPTKSATPWYIAAQLAMGGWISAIFIVCFLVSLLFFTLRISSSLEGPLCIAGGIVFLAVAWVAMRGKGIFTEQFALVFAIAGTIAVAGGIIILALRHENERIVPLAIALATAVIYPFMRNGTYRSIAAVFGLLLLFWGLDFLIWGHMYYKPWRYSQHDVAKLLQSVYLRQVMQAGWDIFLCLSLTYGWLMERKWRRNARVNSLVAPLLRGAYGVLLVSMVLSLLIDEGGEFSGIFDVDVFSALAPLQHMVGFGAGIGLLYCAYMISQALAATLFMRLLFFGVAALALVGGWFLPGLSVGLLGLTLGRYKGDGVILGVTVAALIAYFFCYYYNLNTTLLYKSITLMASGVGLCAVGICIRMVTKREAAVAAGGGHA